jgi:CheY-like chemotaxis protein
MFLDLKLPGMSGIDLCKQIRKENQIAIIHALTGYSNFFGLLECRSAGFDDFFTKPAGLPVLLKTAEHAFEKIERWKVVEHDLV